MSNVDNSENSEDIIAFENVEFFEYVQETHMTELDVHKSLSSVLRRCSRFGLRHNSLTEGGKRRRGGGTKQDRDSAQNIGTASNRFTVPMTQLSISSFLENMLDVVSTQF